MSIQIEALSEIVIRAAELFGDLQEIIDRSRVEGMPPAECCAICVLVEEDHEELRGLINRYRIVFGALTP